MIAIVDQDPEDQYLYPDMLMAQHHLQQAGIETLIVDPAELTYLNEALWAGSSRVDMVYNIEGSRRKTEFPYLGLIVSSVLTQYKMTNKKR